MPVQITQQFPTIAHPVSLCLPLVITGDVPGVITGNGIDRVSGAVCIFNAAYSLLSRAFPYQFHFLHFKLIIRTRLVWIIYHPFHLVPLHQD